VHAHETKCCFFLPVHTVASTQAILFHNVNIVKEPMKGELRLLRCEVSRLMISQLSAHAPGSHLTKARANSGKFINHGIKPSGQQ